MEHTNILKKIWRAAGTTLIAIAMVGCGGGGGGDVPLTKTGVPLYTTASPTVGIVAGSSSSFTMGGGGGGAATTTYSATSNNTAVATVTVSGSKLVINGIANGTATVMVMDSSGSGNSVSITVNVGGGVNGTTTALYTTAQTAITMAANISSSYLIAGGTGPYTVTTSNAQIATASIAGNTLQINSVGSGTATIAAFDTTGTSVKVTVTVSGQSSANLYTTAPSTLTVAPGMTSYSYTIAGGTGPYVANSSNPAVASALVLGNTLTVTGISAGTASIYIYDAVGANTMVALTVGTGTASNTALFTTSMGAVTIASGANATYIVGGGKPPYTITSNNTAIATATIAGNTLTINGVGPGIATIYIVDSINTSISTAVTVGSALGLFTTAPNAVTIAAGSSPSYAIHGGVAPYTATSSNTAVATVALSGTTYTVTGVTAGTATIALVDSSGAYVSLSVTVK